MIFSTALITAWLAAPALAQDSPRQRTGDPQASEAAVDGPPPLIEAPVIYASGWVWKNVTPQGAGRFVALDTGGGWAVAADALGGVWRSRTGDTWYPVLDAPAGDDGTDEEALLLEAQSLMEDFFDGAEIVDEDSNEDLTGLEEVDPLGVQSLLNVDEDEQGEAAITLWVSGELVLLSRTDGLWLSNDAGRSFRKTGEAGRFLSFVRGPAGMIVGGTASGALYSLDGGRSWIDGDDSLDGRAVTQLSAGVHGFWYAVADGAVYTSADAEVWEVLPLDPALTRVDAVLEDPDISESIWLAQGSRLFRLDRGETERLGSHPLGRLSRLRPTGSPGHLLWAGGDGVWESRDGGTSWRSVSAGLSAPQVNDVAVAGAGPVAVTDSGVFLLIKQILVENRGSTDTSAQVEVSFGLLLDRAMIRPGMDPGLHGTGARATVVRRLLPEVIIRAQYSDDRQLYAYYTGKIGDTYTGYNTSSEQTDLYVQAELRWGGSSYSDGETSFDVADVTDQLFVLGDTVYVDSPDNQFTASAAANVTGKAATYRTRVGAELARLHADREQLLIDRESLRGEDLIDRVQHELAIHEVNARIDAYTDGALDALLRGSPP